MSRPKVAVIGSCVSRDVFNSEFTPGYKTYVDVVDTLYQSSLPSVVREFDIDSDLSEDIRPNFMNVMKKELLGKKLGRIVALQPDVLLIDFFADIHFGVTTRAGQYITRNHMAFKSLESADAFYGDAETAPPQRMRFVKGAGGEEYQKVARKAIRAFADILEETSPQTSIVLNAARFSTMYQIEPGELVSFGNHQRLIEKNANWDELDRLFLDETGCEQIVHDPSNLIGSVGHPWGLHPVHYVQSYYDNLWDVLSKTMSQKK